MGARHPHRLREDYPHTLGQGLHTAHQPGHGAWGGHLSLEPWLPGLCTRVLAVVCAVDPRSSPPNLPTGREALQMCWPASLPRTAGVLCRGAAASVAKHASSAMYFETQVLSEQVRGWALAEVSPWLGWPVVGAQTQPKMGCQGPPVAWYPQGGSLQPPLM